MSMFIKIYVESMNILSGEIIADRYVTVTIHIGVVDSHTRDVNLLG